MRGNPADYDEWRQRGCTGWDWDSVLPYFKKAEDQERGANAFHGIGGPLRVSNHPFRLEMAEHWIAAAIEAGLPANDDFNDGAAGRSRAFPEHDQPAPPLEHRGCLSRSRRATGRTSRSQPTRTPRAILIENRRGRRRRLCCQWRRAHRPRAQRGDRLRRRVQFAATAAAVGARTGPAAATVRHPGDPRHAGRRCRSAGPFLLSAFNSAARSRSR